MSQFRELVEKVINNHFNYLYEENNEYDIIELKTTDEYFEYAKDTNWTDVQQAKKFGKGFTLKQKFFNSLRGSMEDANEYGKPSFVIINKQNPNEKYYLNTYDELYIEDKNGKHIDEVKFLEDKPEIRNILRSYPKIKHDCPIVLPKNITNYQDCIDIINEDPRYLEYIPNKYKDYNLCLMAIEKDPSALYNVPTTTKDYNKLCLIAIRQNPFVLQHIPDEMKDYNMCMTAIKKNGYALIFVPDKIKDYKMCITSLKTAHDEIPFMRGTLIGGELWASIPKEFQDYNMYLTVCLMDHDSYYYVPKEYKEKIAQELNIK